LPGEDRSILNRGKATGTEKERRGKDEAVGRVGKPPDERIMLSRSEE